MSAVVQGVPIGTNLGVFHLLWMLLSRGAVIPGLAAWGLPEEGVRRARAALAYGRWAIGELVGKAPPAIPIGIAAGVGSVGEQRLTIPRLLVRGW